MTAIRRRALPVPFVEHAPAKQRDAQGVEQPGLHGEAVGVGRFFRVRVQAPDDVQAEVVASSPERQSRRGRRGLDAGQAPQAGEHRVVERRDRGHGLGRAIRLIPRPAKVDSGRQHPARVEARCDRKQLRPGSGRGAPRPRGAAPPPRRWHRPARRGCARCSAARPVLPRRASLRRRAPAKVAKGDEPQHDRTTAARGHTPRTRALQPTVGQSRQLRGTGERRAGSRPPPGGARPALPPPRAGATRSGVAA